MKQETFSWKGNRDLQIYAQSYEPDVTPLSVVALVHGLGEHLGRYQHVVEAFTQAGHAVLAFDLPGHGRSGGKRGHGSFEEIADEISHLLDEAARRYPRKPRFLYGHSLGGELVLYYLLKRQPQITGAIVTSPGLVPGSPVPGWKLLLGRTLNNLLPDFLIANGLDLNNLSHDRQVIDTYRADPLVHDRISTRLGWDLLESGKWIMDHAADLSVPLLMVWGSGDTIVSPQAAARFAEAAPADKITAKTWQGLYHETHNEPEKQQVIQYTLAWVSSQLTQSLRRAAQP